MEYLWILSRTPMPSDEDYAAWLQTAKDMLPQYDFVNQSPRDEQGSMCTYADDENPSFVQRLRKLFHH
eukprot:CAMPEP_0176366312 /NCGR_PEP_ID=MMETSP0126-20121128/21092_1 /TAXON_ID=141414 ORGANISM="Strombidinopsis acuminatum, Strain SPMC142" /NCGR_SAMPLE_ID=MMETSP0126 /ASSEMBLY_ACC=CAM_ASM_000229 /LENGTH=67 /DNA_ID=CAMNT_0017723683 /DNA_START=434 /DNA_END=637 /DNA_ORIENTATION=-